MNTLAVIPARGGSTGLRRKNLLPDANGVSLVVASARAARNAGCEVVVSTDDDEIAAVCAGFEIHRRGPELADVPVDHVVQAVAHDRDRIGPVLLIQPTAQPITADLLRRFIDAAEVWGEAAALGVEDRHLTWAHVDGIVQVLSDRVERQRAAAWPIREVGVRWWPSSSISAPARVIAAADELVDIDTADDYRRIEHRLRIQFATVANRELGWGHLHRTLTLAEGLQHHDVAIGLSPETDDIARAFVNARGWPTAHDAVDVDVVVHDILDGRIHRDAPTVNFETTLTDGTVTINALYGHGDYTGSRYAVLRPEFLTGDYQIRVDGARVLVLFGGTDPSNLTELAVRSLPDVDIDVLRPRDGRSVSDAMRNADLLITSGGRTVYEAAAVGIPAVVLSQNVRETTHTHLGVGNLHLGLGRVVDPYSLRRLVVSLLADYPTRRELSTSARASIDGRGAERCRRIIEHVGLFGEKP